RRRTIVDAQAGLRNPGRPPERRPYVGQPLRLSAYGSSKGSPKKRGAGSPTRPGAFSTAGRVRGPAPRFSVVLDLFGARAGETSDDLLRLLVGVDGGVLDRTASRRSEGMSAGE